MTIAQPQDKYVLRMPDGLRECVKAAAASNGRSMNTEIVRLIEAGMQEPGEATKSVNQTPKGKSETLTIRLSADLRARVEAAIAQMPYHPTITTVVERGLELAIAEMTKISKDIASGRYEEDA